MDTAETESKPSAKEEQNLCDICEEVPVAVQCKACDESFCLSCDTQLHKPAKMRIHERMRLKTGEVFGGKDVAEHHAAAQQSAQDDMDPYRFAKQDQSSSDPVTGLAVPNTESTIATVQEAPAPVAAVQYLEEQRREQEQEREEQRRREEEEEEAQQAWQPPVASDDKEEEEELWYGRRGAPAVDEDDDEGFGMGLGLPVSGGGLSATMLPRPAPMAAATPSHAPVSSRIPEAKDDDFVVVQHGDAPEEEVQQHLEAQQRTMDEERAAALERVLQSSPSLSDDAGFFTPNKSVVEDSKQPHQSEDRLGLFGGNPPSNSAHAEHDDVDEVARVDNESHEPLKVPFHFEEDAATDDEDVRDNPYKADPHGAKRGLYSEPSHVARQTSHQLRPSKKVKADPRRELRELQASLDGPQLEQLSSELAAYEEALRKKHDATLIRFDRDVQDQQDNALREERLRRENLQLKETGDSTLQVHQEEELSNLESLLNKEFFGHRQELKENLDALMKQKMFAMHLELARKLADESDKARESSLKEPDEKYPVEDANAADDLPPSNAPPVLEAQNSWMSFNDADLDQGEQSFSPVGAPVVAASLQQRHPSSAVQARRSAILAQALRVLTETADMLEQKSAALRSLVDGIETDTMNRAVSKVVVGRQTSGAAPRQHPADSASGQSKRRRQGSGLRRSRDSEHTAKRRRDPSILRRRYSRLSLSEMPPENRTLLRQLSDMRPPPRKRLDVDAPAEDNALSSQSNQDTGPSAAAGRTRTGSMSGFARDTVASRSRRVAAARDAHLRVSSLDVSMLSDDMEQHQHQLQRTPAPRRQRATKSSRPNSVPHGHKQRDIVETRATKASPKNSVKEAEHDDAGARIERHMPLARSYRKASAPYARDRAATEDTLPADTLKKLQDQKARLRSFLDALHPHHRDETESEATGTGKRSRREKQEAQLSRRMRHRDEHEQRQVQQQLVQQMEHPLDTNDLETLASQFETVLSAYTGSKATGSPVAAEEVHVAALGLVGPVETTSYGVVHEQELGTGGTSTANGAKAPRRRTQRQSGALPAKTRKASRPSRSGRRKSKTGKPAKRGPSPLARPVRSRKSSSKREEWTL